MGKEVYRIKGSDLNRMINEAIDEKMLDFGIQTRKNNRLSSFKYARLYGDMVAKVQAVAQQLNQRLQILQRAEQAQGQVSEGIGGFVGKAITGSAKLVRRNGLKGGMKAANKLYGKGMRKRLFIGALASMAAIFANVPGRIAQWVEKFKTPGQTTPKEVITAYGELAEWMQEMCQTTQEHPELLGAASLSDETLNGPEEVEGDKFSVKDGVELAASVGISFVPIVGWAYDAVDIAASLVSAGAENDKEGLKTVGQQYQYLNKAVTDMNKALAQSSNPQAAQTATRGQQSIQQQPQQQAQAQLPNGYVIGRPAPFANNDPAQVGRLQKYLGLQATNRWDRNTQAAWDNWLKQTYQA